MNIIYLGLLKKKVEWVGLKLLRHSRKYDQIINSRWSMWEGIQWDGIHPLFIIYIFHPSTYFIENNTSPL